MANAAFNNAADIGIVSSSSALKQRSKQSTENRKDEKTAKRKRKVVSAQPNVLNMHPDDSFFERLERWVFLGFAFNIFEDPFAIITAAVELFCYDFGLT